MMIFFYPAKPVAVKAKNERGLVLNLPKCLCLFKRGTAAVTPEKLLRLKEQKSRPNAKPSKKEIGRMLRLALLSLDPDDLLNIQTLKEGLARQHEPYEEWLGFDCPLYSDDSKIYAVMKELKIRFLKPGDFARWTCNGKFLRELLIQADGKPKYSGMTLQEASKIKNKTIEINFPGQNAPDSAPKVG